MTKNNPSNTNAAEVRRQNQQAGAGTTGAAGNTSEELAADTTNAAEVRRQNQQAESNK